MTNKNKEKNNIYINTVSRIQTEKQFLDTIFFIQKENNIHATLVLETPKYLGTLRAINLFFS